MSDHAKLSPSSRYRWAACPASVKACEKYEGERTSSPAAIDGTHSHTLLEACIKNWKKAGSLDPQRFLGTVLQDHEGMFGVDQDRINRVRVATDYIAKQCAPESVVLSETRVNPAALLGRDDMSGTVDVQIITGNHLEVIDYKDGMNPVEAKDNQQLEQYVVGVLAESQTIYDQITMTVIQPKVALKGGNPITSHTYAADDFFPKVAQMIQEASATDDPDAPFVPGDKQCTYCPNRGNCSAFNNHALQAAGIKFENMEVVKEAAAKDPSAMDDEQLRELVEAGPLLRKLIESAEAEALSRITAGHPVAGLKVVRGPGRRGWAMPEEETAAKLARMGIPKSSIWETVLISPAKAEKLKWEKRDGTVKQLSERQLETLNKELVTKGDGKLTVVPEADRREAVDYGNLQTMFQPAIPSWLS